MLRARPSNLDYHKPRAVGVQKSTQVHRYLDHHSEDEVDAVASELLYEATQRRSHVSFSAAAFQAFAVEADVSVLVKLTNCNERTHSRMFL